MPIKAATNYLAALNDDGHEQTIQTNIGSSQSKKINIVSIFLIFAKMTMYNLAEKNRLLGKVKLQ